MCVSCHYTNITFFLFELLFYFIIVLVKCLWTHLKRWKKRVFKICDILMRHFHFKQSLMNFVRTERYNNIILFLWFFFISLYFFVLLFYLLQVVRMWDGWYFGAGRKNSSNLFLLSLFFHFFLFFIFKQKKRLFIRFKRNESFLINTLSKIMTDIKW